MKFTDVLRSIELVDVGGKSRPTHASALLLWYSRPHADVRSVLELGCGSGIVSIGMAKLYGRRVTGIDCDVESIEIAKRSSEINGVSDRTEFFRLDVREVPGFFEAETFDMVVFNPPHFTGKVESPDIVRARVRTASEEIVEAFCRAASWSLRNRGEFAVVLHPENMMLWIERLREVRLEPKRMVFFHPKGREAELVALRGRKNSKVGLIVDSPILEG